MYGKCSYVLADHCQRGEEKKEFEIIVKNDNCNDNTLFTSCARTIAVNLTSTNTLITMGSRKERDGRTVPTLKVNGKDIRRHETSQYHVSMVGEEGVVFMLRQRELKVHWSGRNLHISVGHEFENKTCGLCGTYNFNKGDDFLTREGSVETDVIDFVESWQYLDTEKEEGIYSYNQFNRYFCFVACFLLLFTFTQTFTLMICTVSCPQMIIKVFSLLG